MTSDFTLADFIQPCKLTKQKRQTENLKELERYQHKAFDDFFNMFILYHTKRIRRYQYEQREIINKVE